MNRTSCSLSQPHQHQSRKKGIIIVTFGVGLFMLSGFAGLALDVSYLHMWKRMAQTAADAAAQTAAIELKRTRSGTAAQTAARSDAAANGFTHGVDSTVVVDNPPSAGSHAGDNRFAQVTVNRLAPTYFLRVFGRDAVNVAATAVSGLSQMDACVFVLEPSGNNAMQVSGSPQVDMSCGIHVNSTSSSALQVTGGATINTFSFNVVGGTQISTNATISPAPLTGISAEDDPLSWRPNPNHWGCSENNFHVNGGGQNNSTIYLDPGTYCGGIRINSDRPIVFRPGLYILHGGGLTISSQSSVTGTDVTIFNTGSAWRSHGNISITGGATLNLRAPRSGNYEALLIFEDRTEFDNNPNHIEGNSNSNIEGIIYMPNSVLNYAGGSGTVAEYNGIVTKTLAFTGNSTFRSNYNVLANGSPLMRSVLIQ